jgi:hypothetical protein
MSVQAMDLLKVALNFSSVVTLGLRQFGAGYNLCQSKVTCHRNAGVAVVCSSLG